MTNTQTESNFDKVVIENNLDREDERSFLEFVYYHGFGKSSPAVTLENLLREWEEENKW